MSDLFGNHIVGFPTGRLIYNYWVIFQFAEKYVYFIHQGGVQAYETLHKDKIMCPICD